MSTAQGTRIVSLDFLRGIAVLGLLLMNIVSMGAVEIGYVRFEPDLLSDKIIAGIQVALFDGRFRSLFCILFAIGLYLQSLSYQRDQLNSYVILKSRIHWLLIFGLIHCIFIWPGDILILYALTGLYIVSKLDWPAEKLLKRGFIFFVIGMVILVAEVLFLTDAPLTRGEEAYQELLSGVHEGYLYYLILNAFLAVIYIVTFPILSLFYFAGVMFLGLGLYKSGRLQQGFNRKEVNSLVILTLLFSIVDVYWAVKGLHPEMRGVIGSASGLTMALLIWHIVIKSNLAERMGWLSQALQRTGRMAFTSYILQSIVMVSLFRFIYPQWIESFSLIDYMQVAACFIIFNLVFAYYYFDVFKQGPLEKLWRYLVNKTYNKQKAEYAITQQENQV